MHSVSDLTTSSRRTSGSIPPKLVGASTTVIGDRMYLFGGRLVAERRMVADLYVCDLETFVWTRVPAHSSDDAPRPRYFHSADGWGNYLVIFGGMGHRPDGTSADDLIVLNDIRFMDLSTFRWLPADVIPSRSYLPTNGAVVDTVDPASTERSHLSNSDANSMPRARYAHLSAISGSRLYIIGGQDLQNAWLDDVCVYDLCIRCWIARHQYPRHAGTYRSVAVAAQYRVRDLAREREARTATSATVSDSGIGPLGGRFSVDRHPPSQGGERSDFTSSDSLIHLPYSADPTDDFPNEIFLYSNYNFTDVKRELEIFTPLSGTGNFELSDRSSSMTGPVLPPGLRFPTGAICGNHLIFAGTYLAHSFQSYSIWALDLTTMSWSRLDPGAALATGSWFRAALWNQPSKGTSSLLIFGNREGSLVEDYNRRLLAWNDVAVLDLEAFGIYQPPKVVLNIKAQELGVAALEEELLADFELVCEDGRRVPVSRWLLEARWPWFREQHRHFRDSAARAVASSTEGLNVEQLAEATGPPYPTDVPPPPTLLAASIQADPRPDPRITPRALMLSEPYAVTLAFAQYIYTQALITPLQHAPAVLSQLMLLSSTYGLTHLQTLVRHAMHRALAPSTSVGVYEVATLCGCQSLQIRALKAVMASSKRNTGRARGNSSAGTGPGGSGGGTSSRGPAGSSDREGLNGNGTRSRGASDVRTNYTYGGSGTEAAQSGGAHDMNNNPVVRKTTTVGGVMSAEGLSSNGMTSRSNLHSGEIRSFVPSFSSSSSSRLSAGSRNRSASFGSCTGTAALKRKDKHCRRESTNLCLNSIITALQEVEEEYGHAANPESATNPSFASKSSRPISRVSVFISPNDIAHRRTRRAHSESDFRSTRRHPVVAVPSISSSRQHMYSASDLEILAPSTDSESVSSSSTMPVSLPVSPRDSHHPLASVKSSPSTEVNLTYVVSQMQFRTPTQLVTDSALLHLPKRRNSIRPRSVSQSQSRSQNGPESEAASTASAQTPPPASVTPLAAAVGSHNLLGMSGTNVPVPPSPMTPESPMIATPTLFDSSPTLRAPFTPHLNAIRETRVVDEELVKLLGLDMGQKVVMCDGNDDDDDATAANAETYTDANTKGHAEDYGGCREFVVDEDSSFVSAEESIVAGDDHMSETYMVNQLVDLPKEMKSQPAFVVSTPDMDAFASTSDLSHSSTPASIRVSLSGVLQRSGSLKTRVGRSGKGMSRLFGRVEHKLSVRKSVESVFGTKMLWGMSLRSETGKNVNVMDTKSEGKRWGRMKNVGKKAAPDFHIIAM